MNAYWQEDWHHNPLIQRSKNPELKRMALNLIRFYVERGDSIERMMLANCGWVRRDVRTPDVRQTAVIGGYLIPGGKTWNGLRASSTQIGTLLEYNDGRVEWNLFSLAKAYDECRQGEKPHQLELFA